MCFLVANCRAIKNKIASLDESMTDCGASFSVLSETWINAKNFNRIKNDLKAGFGLGVISRGRVGKNGGGVAIVWRNSQIAFEKHCFFSGEFELIAAKTKMGVAGKSLYVFALYLPPSMKVEAVEKMNELIVEEMEKIKVKERDPMFVIAGDFNKKNCDHIVDSFPGIQVLTSPPTRGNNQLDLCLTDIPGCTTRTAAPLDSIGGTESDHMVLVVSFTTYALPKQYIKIVRRKITKKGEDEFITLMNSHDWSPLYQLTSATEKNGIFAQYGRRIQRHMFPV